MTISSRSRYINVLPNPWSALDDQGNPCGICPVDPGLSTRRDFVGARFESAEVIEKIPEGDLRHPRQYNNWVFSEEPVRVEATPYYLEKLRSAELLPADAEAAKAAGIGFTSVVEATKVQVMAAVAKWRGQHGEVPSWFTEPPEPTARQPKYKNEPSTERKEEKLWATTRRQGWTNPWATTSTTTTHTRI
jgi:hypothetical protein